MMKILDNLLKQSKTLFIGNASKVNFKKTGYSEARLGELYKKSEKIAEDVHNDNEVLLK